MGFHPDGAFGNFQVLIFVDISSGDPMMVVAAPTFKTRGPHRSVPSRWPVLPNPKGKLA